MGLTSTGYLAPAAASVAISAAALRVAAEASAGDCIECRPLPPGKGLVVAAATPAGAMLLRLAGAAL